MKYEGKELTAADESVDIEIEQLQDLYKMCGGSILSIVVVTERGCVAKIDSRAVASQLCTDIRPAILSLINRLEESKAKFVKSLFKRNLNEQCGVVLTQCGADILNRRSEEIEKQYQTKLFPRHKAGEIYKTQLWGLFDTFGEHISPSLETPFSGLTINFFKEEDKAE